SCSRSHGQPLPGVRKARTMPMNSRNACAASSRAWSCESTRIGVSGARPGCQECLRGKTMLVDLVQVTTRDGFRLDGAYLAPSGPKSLPLDALCFVHGTGGNFYSSTLFDALTDRLRALGCGVLRINTRGHDGISTASTDRGGRR